MLLQHPCPNSSRKRKKLVARKERPKSNIKLQESSFLEPKSKRDGAFGSNFLKWVNKRM
jgi:hypothetical protein